MGIDELRGTVRGAVLLPGDAGFEQAARPWNVAVTQSVGAVVTATDAEDIAATVGWARRAGRTVVTQPTGHGATGDIDDAVLLRTGALDDIAIDPVRRRA
ncbi:FAD-binding protein, partial [Nocardia sp. No.11]